jgi:hypothetical protein
MITTSSCFLLLMSVPGGAAPGVSRCCPPVKTPSQTGWSRQQQTSVFIRGMRAAPRFGAAAPASVIGAKCRRP